jgi:hypothetical protein
LTDGFLDSCWINGDSRPSRKAAHPDGRHKSEKSDPKETETKRTKGDDDGDREAA